MGHRTCFEFGERNLADRDMRDKDVLEVGAHEDGGSMRPYVSSYSPSSYVGLDIQPGPGVDVVCDAMDILDRFGPESFDIIIANELLEHLRYWREFIHIAKTAIRPQGVMIFTTRSKGFPFHHAPFDFWRYEEEDMREIFSDCEILAIESDTREVNGWVTPGVFVAARKPSDFVEKDLADIELHSILTEERMGSVSNMDILKYEVSRLGLGYFAKHNFIPFLMREYLSQTKRRMVQS